MLRMEDQRCIQHLCLEFRVFPVRPQHEKDILRQGKALFRIADEQRLIQPEMPVGVIGVYGDQRQFGDEIHGLAQYIFRGNVLRVVVIGIERQHAPLHGVHDVLVGRLHDHITDKPAAQALQLKHNIMELLRLLLIRQPAEKQQVDRLLKPVLAALQPFDQIADVNPLIIEMTLRRDLPPVAQLIPRHIGNLRQTGQHALTIGVTQPPLHIVFQIEVRVNPVIVHQLLFQNLHLLF